MVDYVVTLVKEFHHFPTEKRHHKSEKKGEKELKTNIKAIATDSSLLRK